MFRILALLCIISNNFHSRIFLISHLLKLLVLQIHLMLYFISTLAIVISAALNNKQNIFLKLVLIIIAHPSTRLTQKTSQTQLCYHFVKFVLPTTLYQLVSFLDSERVHKSFNHRFGCNHSIQYIINMLNPNVKTFAVPVSLLYLLYSHFEQLLHFSKFFIKHASNKQLSCAGPHVWIFGQH